MLLRVLSIASHHLNPLSYLEQNAAVTFKVLRGFLCWKYNFKEVNYGIKLNTEQQRVVVFSCCMSVMLMESTVY